MSGRTKELSPESVVFSARSLSVKAKSSNGRRTDVADRHEKTKHEDQAGRTRNEQQWAVPGNVFSQKSQRRKEQKQQVMKVEVSSSH